MSTNGPRRSGRPSTLPVTNAASASAIKNRHLSHLHSQLAQLSANLSDLENLLRMTAVQAEAMRGLGGYSGSLYVSLSTMSFLNILLTCPAQVHGLCESAERGGRRQGRGQQRTAC